MSSAGNSKESSTKWSNPFKKQGSRVASSDPSSAAEKETKAASESSAKRKEENKEGIKRNPQALVVNYFPSGGYVGRL